MTREPIDVIAYQHDGETYRPLQRHHYTVASKYR